MRIVVVVIGVVLVLLGALWILQGSNVIAGSVMSGKSVWLYAGIAVLIVGGGALVAALRRRG